MHRPSRSIIVLFFVGLASIVTTSLFASVIGSPVCTSNPAEQSFGAAFDAIYQRPGRRAHRDNLRAQGLNSTTHLSKASLSKEPYMGSCGTPITKGNVQSRGMYHATEKGAEDSCLVTVCDDPDYVRGYQVSLERNIIPHVTAHVRVYSVAKSDGSDPYSTPEKSEYQRQVMNDAFKEMRVEYTMQDYTIKSDFLWYGEITPYECNIQNVGNGIRDLECLNKYNGYDGGDWFCSNPTTCDPICSAENILSLTPGTEGCTCICFNYRACQNSMIGDGVCQDECNSRQNQYDGGDCCQDATLGKCYDPSRPLLQRSFADISEIRPYVQSDFVDYLYIYVGSVKSEMLAGISVFPWTVTFDSSSYGGLLLEESIWGFGSFYHGSVAAHEIGHSMGLWHTFHGVSEVDGGCNDACYEPQTSVGGTGTMLKGDLCSDTRPTPVTFDCKDPTPCPQGFWDLSCSDCNNNPWVDTPIKNRMGYSLPVDLCYNQTFSSQQFARMRCYYDMYYTNWDSYDVPGTIVLPPTVTTINNITTVRWGPPLDEGNAGALYYQLRRTPAFDEGDITLYSTYYRDKTASSTVKYSYQVRAGNNAGWAEYFSPVWQVHKTSANDSVESVRKIIAITAGVILAIVVISAVLISSSKRKHHRSSHSHCDACDMFFCYICFCPTGGNGGGGDCSCDCGGCDCGDFSFCDWS